MKKIIVTITLLFFCLATTVMAHTKQEKGTGILLVSFGSSYPTAQASFDHINELVKETFPGIEVRWAFTSNIIRKKLKERGQKIDSPAEALAKMGADGFTKIAVQSLHVIPGEEYKELLQTVEAFNLIPKNAKKIVLGKPLLYYHNDIKKACTAIQSILPAKIKASEAMVFMGHGTAHPSNIFYPGLQYYLWQQSPNIFIGTVEGYPGLKEVIAGLKAKKTKKVWLQPFMSVAGDHALNDMTGDDSDSWKSQLEAAGFDVHPILKGLGEFDAIDAIWIRHLEEIFNDL